MSENWHPDEETLNAYLDGELQKEMQLEVENHLSACASCVDQLEELRMLFRAIESVEDIIIARDLSSLVLNQINLKRPSGATGQTKTLWLVGFVQGVMAVLFIAFSWPSLERWVIMLQNSNFIAQSESTLHAILSSFWQVWFYIQSNALLWVTRMASSWSKLKTWHIPMEITTFQWAVFVMLALVCWIVANSVLIGNKWQKNISKFL